MRPLMKVVFAEQEEEEDEEQEQEEVNISVCMHIKSNTSFYFAVSVSKILTSSIFTSGN